VEEVYEVLEAIDLEDSEKLCEELGDLLLQVVFHARVAEESGIFSMQDVIDGVSEKMVRRHPHVFGEVTVQDAAEVVVNWEAIKKQEKIGERKGVLDGIPKGLPALLRAYKLQTKAAKVGFDWDDIAPVWDKVREEIAELTAAAAAKNLPDIEEELGDVLFAVVNLARFLGVEAETALNGANNKFMRRFQYIEDKVVGQGLEWDKLTLKELDRIWDEAKQANLREKYKNFNKN
jgi:tetrapyrrole methylase family protein/MazG family protein